MTNRFTRLAAALVSSTLLVSLAACTTTKENKPTYKKATSTCLIKSDKDTPGSPSAELAANLVEAQVVFGVRARVVEIKDNESVSIRLLRALQAGCVLMASAETRYLDALATFARGHSKMMVFFVGGQLAEVDQPANLRWFKDDLTLAARLAGFHAAELGSTISLFIQPSFHKANSMSAAVAEGIREYERVTGQDRTLTTQQVSRVADLEANLQLQPQPEVVILLAGESFWKVIPNYPELKVIGADLQFGQSANPSSENVLGSIERGTSIHLLRTVSALLNRDFANTPPIRSEKSITDGLVQFRFLTEPSDLYTSYLQQLETNQ